MRLTKTYTAVTDTLQQNHFPVSLAEIFASVQKTHPTTAFSTVYRIMARLERDGDVVRVDWRERGSRYEWARRPHHHHVTCEKCGCVRDISDADVQFSTSALCKKTGFTITNHTIELTGVCDDCA